MCNDCNNSFCVQQSAVTACSLPHRCAGKQHESYESYYDCHCADVGRWATALFYAYALFSYHVRVCVRVRAYVSPSLTAHVIGSGTLVLLVAGALLIFARLSLTYSSFLAAGIYVGVTVLTFTALVLVNWLVPNKTSVTERTEAQDAEDDARAMVPIAWLEIVRYVWS